MTRSDLIRALAERHGLSRRAAREVLAEILAELREALTRGERVEIRGFGTWRARHYPAYTGRNPRTGDRVSVDEKVLPVFRPGRALLERLEQGATLED
jgi:integration host factor subunit beta